MKRLQTTYDNNGNNRRETPNSDLEVLRLALQSLYGVDCEETAMRLLARFGGLGGILNASREELKAQRLTDRAAAFLSFLRPFQRQAVLRDLPGYTVDCEASAVEFAAMYFLHTRNTLDAVVFLDGNGHILDVSNIDARSNTHGLIATVCRRSVGRVLLIRNGPRNGRIETIKELERQDMLISGIKSLEFMGFEAIDCITVSGGWFVSASGGSAMRPIDEASTEPYRSARSVVRELVVGRDSRVLQVN